MAKLVALRVEGTFEQGFQIWMELGSVGDRPSIAVRAALPAAPIVLRFYQEWQSVYRSLSPLPRIKPKTGQITNVSLIELSTSYQQAAFKLHHALNRWLKSSPFRPIREKLLEQLTPSDEGQILLQTENLQLRQLPWHLWDIFDRYPHMELVLSTPEYERPMLPAIATYRDKVRILAILGDSTGINLNEDRALLEQLSDAETTFLVEPKREQLTEQLWDQPWDILFFAGHSHSQPDGQRGYLHINRHDRLAIDELEKALLIAVRQGLKIALFNSCEGLGLVHQLEGTQIPHIIVMREPVPDPVAQLYLKYFLKAFSHGELLHLAVRHAREKLQGIESKFPCVTWLPVLCSHPTAAIATWQTLGHRPRPDLCPYRGLFTFREADAPFFFGREAFTKLLFESIHRQSLVAIIGASGSGKSSVVFAGLVPQLRQQDWQIITLRPGNRPLHALAMALLAQTEPNMSRVDRLRDIRELTVDLQTEKTALRDVVDDLVWQTPGTRLLLIVDQFEELYTLCRQVKERQVFLDRLLEAVQYCLNFTLVITLRADFMGQALSHRLFADALQHQSLMLGPMTTAELQQAIEQPALRLNVRLEDGLTARILHTISGEPGKLPLLEFALTQLWQQQVDNLLTHAAYDQMGGIEAALGCYAEEVYDHLNEEQKERSRRIFMQLVQPGEGTADTRRVATTAEIGSQHWDLVTQLADARLLVTNRDETTEEVTVELVHEALIQNWERLRLWIDLDRAFRTWQERLRVMFRQWQISRYDREALLRGAPLAEAEGWLQSRPLELNRTEREFIEKSRRLRSRQRQRLLVGLCCGLVAALTLAGIAGWQWQRAEQQRQVACMNKR